MVAAVSMIETIKASGSEFEFFEKIAGYQTKYNNAMQELRRRNILMGIVLEILSEVCTGVVLMLGIYYIFRGEFTIGTLMTFQSFMNLFLSPMGSLVQSVQTFQNMSGYIERVDDVMQYPADMDGYAACRQNAEYEKLGSKVEIKDLCFAYSPLAPALIEHFCLAVEPGRMIALVGATVAGNPL